MTIEDYRLETRPIPEISDEEVLVKILAVGICAGDAKCFAGAPYFWGKCATLCFHGILVSWLMGLGRSSYLCARLCMWDERKMCTDLQQLAVPIDTLPLHR